MKTFALAALLLLTAFAFGQSIGEPVRVLSGECSDAQTCLRNFGLISPSNDVNSFANPSLGFRQTGSACDQYDSYLAKYLPNARNLASVGISADWVKALAYQESGCRQSPANGQGPMQVVACGRAGCSLDENFRRGVGELDRCAAKASSVSSTVGTEGVRKLTGFCYNRGSGSLARAIGFLRQGQGLYDAMDNACLSYFSRALCAPKGYGARYWDQVIVRHKALYGA